MAANSFSSLLEATTTANSAAMPTFRVAHCLADGQLTPPDSPDAPPNSKVAFRNGPRLQLPRLLRRTKTDHEQSSMSVRRSSPVRPYVDGMKAPFPLRLPDSPVDSDCSSSSSTSPVFAQELRRRSPTYHDLRSLAARQKEQFSRRVETPLLPSPIHKDDMIASDSYFTFQNPRATTRPKEYHSYQDLHILSCYYDKDKTTETSGSVAPQHQDHDIRPRTPSDADTDSRSVSTVDTPVTPEEQIYRISTLQSDESGWLANETSVTQREKKFKARCFQVVQQAPTEKSKDGDVVSVSRRRMCSSANLLRPSYALLVLASRSSSRSLDQLPSRRSPLLMASP
jgi:hypothetical protein